MPQMAPMWWSSISLMSFIFVMLMIMVTYFSYTKVVKKDDSKKINYSMNWMW